MKKLPLWTALLIATPALAATTGTLTLQGLVPAATAIVVTGVAPFSALDLATSQVDLAVGTVRETNNTSAGYKVSVASSNAGNLKNGTVGAIPYTAKYSGVAFVLSTAGAVITNAPASATVVDVKKSLAISYTGVAPEAHMVGSYSDTLTFTITAN